MKHSNSEVPPPLSRSGKKLRRSRYPYPRKNMGTIIRKSMRLRNLLCRFRREKVNTRKNPNKTGHTSMNMRSLCPPKSRHSYSPNPSSSLIYRKRSMKLSTHTVLRRLFQLSSRHNSTPSVTTPDKGWNSMKMFTLASSMRLLFPYPDHETPSWLRKDV